MASPGTVDIVPVPLVSVADVAEVCVAAAISAEADVNVAVSVELVAVSTATVLDGVLAVISVSVAVSCVDDESRTVLVILLSGIIDVDETASMEEELEGTFVWLIEDSTVVLLSASELLASVEDDSSTEALLSWTSDVATVTSLVELTTVSAELVLI